jgi:hypothetical protein
MSDPEFNFGANKENIQDEERVPQLDTPFLGEAYLKNVALDNQLGNDNYRVLQMEFICLPPNEAGFSMDSPKQFRVTEWEPDEEDAIPDDPDEDSDIQKMLDRLAYRLKYWIGSEEEAAEVVQMKGDSLAEAWDNLRERIVEAMHPHVPGDTVENPRENDDVKVVRIKVLGSVYYSSRDQTQKASLGMPNYPGVISDDDSEYPVSLSPREKDDNKEWADFQSSSPSDTGDVEPEDEQYEF